MARSNNNLNAVLKDTADAIRVKKGTSEPIVPRDFADEIEAIETGGGDDGAFDILTGNKGDIVIPNDVGIKGEMIDFVFYSNSALRNVDFNNARVVPSGAFQSCSKLQNINGENIRIVNDGAFRWCNFNSLSLSFPNCVIISGFSNCRFVSFNAPNVISITTMSAAMFYCDVSLPCFMSNVPQSAFMGSINSFYAPFAENVVVGGFYNNGFANCNVRFVQFLGNKAFDYCSCLENLNAPYIYSVGDAAFSRCFALPHFSGFFAGRLGTSTFFNCSLLSKVEVGLASASTNGTLYGGNIFASCFYSCSSLESLYLLTCSKANLNNVTAFQNTPMSDSSYLGRFGSIYVPSSWVSSYKADTNWVTYSDRITALPSEYDSRFVYAGEFFNSALTAFPSEKQNVEWILNAAFQNCYSLVGILSLSNCKAIGNLAFASCSISSLDLPECEFIGNGAFYRCRNISEVNLPKVKYIGSNAFSWCSISFLDLPECEFIGSNAFSTAYIKTLSLPKVKFINNSAFYECGPFSEAISLPECVFIGTNAFGSATINQSVLEFPKLKIMGDQVFTASRASYVTNIIMPELTIAGKLTLRNVSSVAFPNLVSASGLFIGWSNLETVSLPHLVFAHRELFSGCSKLTKVYLPNCSFMSYTVFKQCDNLQKCLLPAVLEMCYTGFVSCPKLESVYLFKRNVVNAFPSMPFSSTPMNDSSYLSGRYGSIYVPASLVSAYQNDENWSQFSDRFVGLTDEEMQSIIDHWND